MFAYAGQPGKLAKTQKAGPSFGPAFGYMFDRGVACVPGDLDFDGTVNELNIGN
jgi:hypothetical protein